MEQFLAIVVLAIVIEAVIETVKLAIDGGIKWPYIVSMALGIAVCLLSKQGVVNTLGVNFPWYADAILTGICVSRGSNFVSDLIAKLRAGKTNKEV